MKSKEIVSIESITLRLSGMRGSRELEIVMKDGSAEVSEYGMRYSDGKESRVLECRAQCGEERVIGLLNDCRMAEWNGFSGKHPRGVLDGTMFRLEANVNGGERITADGSANFPKRFCEFTDGLYAILRGEEDR